MYSYKIVNIKLVHIVKKIIFYS